MNRGRISTPFFLAFLMMTLLIVMGCSKSEDAFQVASTAPVNYSISGTVSGATGVTINLTGAATTSATTDSLDAYTITGLASGEYTVTPVKTGYKFTPSSAAVTVSGGTVNVPNFAATSDSTTRYSISGTVSGAVKYQVLITLGGDGLGTTKTDTSGNYTFSNLVAGNYTLTASLAGYAFSQSFLTDPPNIGSASLTGENFTASAVAVSYEQDDLDGTWNMNILRKGASRKEWERVKILVAHTTGKASCVYMSNSTKVLVAQDTLQDALTDTATSFYVTNGAMPAGAVVVQIGDEKISGTYNSSTREIAVSMRGYDSTTAEAHTAGAQVTEIRNNHKGVTDCPDPFDLTLTIDSNGVVTPTGANAPEIGTDMTMTSNKNFIAGTGTDTGPSYQLAIMQKEKTPVTAYASTDVNSKNFVYHQLQFGKIDQWERAVGQTDEGGAIRLTSLTSPSGSASDTPKAIGVSFALDTTTNPGVVTLSGTTMGSFQGFLSDDKKTIVGTFTDNITDPAAVDTGQNDYHLIVFQMDDQTYPAGALPAGTYVAHLLGIGSQFGWSYFTSTVASGVMTFSDFHTSNVSFTAPATTSGSISASGVVTIAGISSYHGQMSYDGKFIVGTQTLASGVYALQVDTK